MSHSIYGWPSWTQEDLSSPGAGPSGYRSNNGEQELNVIPKGAHIARSRGKLQVPQNRAGYSQPSEPRMRAWSHDAGSRFPVGSANLAPSSIAPHFPLPAPSFVASPFPHPATIIVAPPPWASTPTSVPVTHRWAPHVLASTPTPAPDNPAGPLTRAPEELPSPATPATPVTPSLHAISMARVIPTDAQRSAYSALEGAVRPIKGPWVEMAHTVIEVRLDPLWDPSVFRRETRKRGVDAEEQQPLKRARVEEGLREVITEASVVRDTVDEIGVGMVKAREIESGAGSEGSEGTWPSTSRFRCIAPKPAPGPVEEVGGLHPSLVVVPQVDSNALNKNRDTSTTSIHGVDNPAGEFVIEPVPLSSGGPSTSTPADDQIEADKPQDGEDHDEGQHHLGEETSLSASKREAAVVIDEKIYGRDPLRCLACNNKSFGRKYDRRRHVVTVHYLDKVPCDWCDMFFYARRDGVTRHKDENCPAKDFEDRHTNPMRWFMAWLGGPSGWR